MYTVLLSHHYIAPYDPDKLKFATTAFTIVTLVQSRAHSALPQRLPVQVEQAWAHSLQKTH